MTELQWHDFCAFRRDFKLKLKKWSAVSQELKPLQKEAARLNGTPDYPVETPLVYNTALDKVAQTDAVKLIVVADNPGKNEQLIKNQSYLVGQAGKLADSFFRNNPELGIDFRKNVVILNKTPIHSAKTKELSYILKHGSTDVHSVFSESQNWLAEQTLLLSQSLKASIWLVGYGELGKKGLFSVYRDTLIAKADTIAASGIDLLVFQHFSMNRFSIDLKARYQKEKSLAENLASVGLFHRKEVLGF